MHTLLSRSLKPVALILVALLALFAVYNAYHQGNVAVAALMLGAFSLTTYIYTSSRAYVYRYMFPGLAAVFVFVLLPLIYTFYLGFSNYGSKNLLTFERATENFMSET